MKLDCVVYFITMTAKRSKSSGWTVVEQDVLPGLGGPKESVRRKRRYLKSLGI
jgi:hypothetical protein